MNEVVAGRVHRRLLILLLAAAVPLSVRPSSASCAPPDITVGKATVAPGGRLEISGTGWASSCTGPRDEGCGGDDRTAPSPLEDITAVLVPLGGGGEEVELGTVNADEGYAFRLGLDVPPGTSPGRYQLEVSAGEHGADRPVTIVGERRRG